MPRLGAGLPEKRTSKAGLQLGCQPHAISSMSPETEQTETVSPNLAVPSSRFLTTRSQDVVQVDLELSILLPQPLGGDSNPLFMSAPHLQLGVQDFRSPQGQSTLSAAADIVLCLLSSAACMGPWFFQRPLNQKPQFFFQVFSLSMLCCPPLTLTGPLHYQ